MKYLIKKNRHRARPLHFYIFFNKYAIRKRISFGYGCRYNLPGTYNDEDVNKLFGIGFFPHHHKNSARFGWHYNNDTYKIVITAYCYIDGKRVIEKMTEVPVGFAYDYELLINPFSYSLTIFNPNNGMVMSEKIIPHNGVGKLSYPLSVYFGGNNKAPHDLEISMKNL